MMVEQNKIPPPIRQSSRTVRTVSVFIFYVICMVCTIDTHLFVYPSLSRSLLMETGILLLSLIATVHCLFGTDEMPTSSLLKFILGWIAYILFHGWSAPVLEEYRTGYLCITLFSVLPLAYLCGHGLLTRKDIENGLLLIAVIHLIYIIGQIIGLTDSGNTFFSVTGANENPTVTAIYLVGCMPLAMKRVTMKNHSSLYITLSACLLVSVAILKCRTAYIGLFVEGGVWVVVNVRRNPRNAIFKYRRIIIPLALVLVLFASFQLYDMKRNSAAGRLLIWKISAEMIVEKPQGYGYGLFEKHYNLRQADYFRSIQASAQERQRADFTPMAYNDYLE